VIARGGVVEERNFHRLLLAIGSETLDSICRVYLRINMRSDWFFLVLRAYRFLTDNSLQSARKPCCSSETA